MILSAAGRPLHVVHLIARLNEGGPARVLAALVGALGPHGIRCTVLTGECSDGEVDRRDLVAAAGAEVVAVPGLGRRVRPWDDARAFAAVWRELGRRGPDLVHTHTAKAGALGRTAARLRGLPCLHTYHGHVLHGYFTPGIDAAVAAVERALAGRCWHQALTRSQWHELHRIAGIGRAARWAVLPVPVPPIPVAPAPPRPVPVVGWLGRLVPVKDGDLWLDTLAALQAGGPVEGLMCGSGPERERLEAKAAALGLRVRFAGVVPAATALAGMDVLLMTSRNEGQPLAAVEAAGAGIPVVAPPVGGLADLARDGLVWPARREPAALAAAVRMAHGMSLARRERARAAALALAPEPLAARYADLYRRILA